MLLPRKEAYIMLKGSFARRLRTTVFLLTAFCLEQLFQVLC
jgi:hypothetical protein